MFFFLNHPAALVSIFEGLFMAFISFHFSYMVFFSLLALLAVTLAYQYCFRPVLRICGLLRAETPKSSDKYDITAPRSVLITGGARGIGFGLAREYIISKHKSLQTLILLDIDGDQLTQSAQELHTLHESIRKTQNKVTQKTLNIATQVVDVANRGDMNTALQSLHAQYDLDVIIANAGISPINVPNMTMEEQTYFVHNINVSGVMHTIMPLKNHFRARGYGQFVIMSSTAGFMPIVAPIYSATKAFLLSWGRCLRGELLKEGISTVTIAPGFVETDIIKGIDGLPWKISVENICKRIILACDRDESVTLSPTLRWMSAIAFFHTIGPKLLDFLVSLAPERNYNTDFEINPPKQPQAKPTVQIKKKVAKNE